MKKGDRFYKKRGLSNVLETIEILSSYPDQETHIWVQYIERGTKGFIHITKLQQLWKRIKDGIQSEIFEPVNKVNKYRKLFVK